MSDMKIEEFCDKHEACEAGREWALTNCKTMQEVWQTSKYRWLVWIAIQTGAVTDKDLRRFAVFCCRDVWHLLTDERSRNAVEVAERYIVNPRNNNTELDRAWLSAEFVLSGLPVGKHRAAANAAAAVTRSPRYAAEHTEFFATQAAAADGPVGVENIVRGDMARKRKADWLRANVTPDFTEKRRSE